MTQSKPFTVLYDGSCPLCRREAALLRRLDRGKGLLLLEDISRRGFEAESYGRSMQELMAEIHGVLPDGRVVSGMEVFRRAYAAVGLRWLLAPTGWPMIRGLADAAYLWFTKRRLRLTGRCRARAAGCRRTDQSEQSCQAALPGDAPSAISCSCGA
ncbi:MAG TPA: DUF393 domain-containing protein [Phycisphaerae bacterium]|nr:DUF393 domain-containing protein [Phycisphaerae bacterium]